MRYFVLASALALTACSADAPTEPILPRVPTNPLVSLLADEGATYAMTRLGNDETSPFLFNESLCDGLLYRTEIVDSLFFPGDGTFRRVYRGFSLQWRTIGVSEPQQMNGYSSVELKGKVQGEGDVLRLVVEESRQHNEPFAPTTMRNPSAIAFAINGATLSKPETFSTSCNGQRDPTTAFFERISE